MNNKQIIAIALIGLIFSLGAVAYADYTISREQNYKCNTIFNNGYFSFKEHNGLFQPDVCYVMLESGSHVAISDITEEQVEQVVKLDDIKKEPGRPYNMGEQNED